MLNTTAPSPSYEVKLDTECTCLDILETKDNVILTAFGSKEKIVVGELEVIDNDDHLSNEKFTLQLFRNCQKAKDANALTNATVIQVSFYMWGVRKDEDATLKFEVNTLKEIAHPGSISHVAISLATSLSELPRKLVLATAGSGLTYALRVYKTDLAEEESCMDLEGHKSYINSISFDAANGQYLASASDDHTCRLWSTETGACISIYTLTSPGVAVSWHPDEPMKLLVAEKGGMIRLYNVATHKVARTIDATSVAPVLSVDWDRNDRSKIVVGANACCYIWNLNKICRPEEVRQLHNQSVSKVVFGRAGRFVASLGYPGPSLRILGEDLDIEPSGRIEGARTIRTHPSMPFAIVGSVGKLVLWRIPVEA